MRIGRSNLRRVVAASVSAGALVLAVPLIAQRTPTSLLPPGFGGQPAPEETMPEPETPAQNPSAPGRAPGQAQVPVSLPAENAALPGNAQEAQLTPEELAKQQEEYDLPDEARRSLDRIGPLTPRMGGLAPDAFGRQSGRFLATLMRETRAPLVSRWGSILLRRTLLSATDTPGDIDGADWAAERAWMLVRMGEADPARLLVQSVDNAEYTPRLYAVAMQAYLAAADPVGMCPIYQGALTASRSASWRMAEAICASFAAEQGRASAVLNQEQRRGQVRGIDYRLAEKIVGAGTNARRSVKIEWEGVDRLTAWRFGLATAANVAIPTPLMAAAGDQVRAWQARAPMLPLATRLPSAETAARLGVFSGAALVDLYSQMDGAEDAPADFQNRGELLRRAYAAPTAAERIEAMRDLWGRNTDPFLDLIALSRAAAVLPVSEASGADAGRLIAAMLTAGYDRSAARWARSPALQEDDGTDGWALLAVGAPTPVVRLDTSRLGDYVAADGRRGEMLLAGLAGLGRIGGEELGRMAGNAGLDFRARSRWEQAIDRAARRREKGTVALLAAVGMQARDWHQMPVRHVYHIVAALHRAGLDAEARMIAAEAVMRS